MAGSSIAGVAFLSLTSARRGSAAPHSPAPSDAAAFQAPVAPGEWRTWYLSSADQLRPDAPGDPTQEEINEIVQMQGDRTEEMDAAAVKWGTGMAIAPWTALLGELYVEFAVGGMPQARLGALYYTAIHDAVIAAWDAQVTYERPGPAATSPDVTPMAGVDPDVPSFPSAHAAIAGAASTVLTELFPEAEAGRFDAIAEEAAESRIFAGAAFRSDVEAGLALGRAVGELAVDRARTDGSDAEWDPSTRLTGPGYWEPTPPGFVDTPVSPMAGTWKTWVMTSGDQYRPAPPPKYGSPAWEAELKTIQEINANLSFEQRRAASWWASNSPAMLYTSWAQDLIGKEGRDLPHAAQILADMNVANADAVIAVWDAKYTWWTARPITEDPDLETVVPTPPYPSFPSGYSAVVGSMSTVVGHFFPEAADDMITRAAEAAASRGWAGIHFVLDDDIGLTMGKEIGRLICSLPGAKSS